MSGVTEKRAGFFKLFFFCDDDDIIINFPEWLPWSLINGPVIIKDKMLQSHMEPVELGEKTLLLRKQERQDESYWKDKWLRMSRTRYIL